MGSPPPFARNYHPITPFLSTTKNRTPPNFDILGPQKLMTNVFFLLFMGVALDGLKLSWWVGPRKSTLRPKDSYEKDCQNFQPQQKGSVCFLVDSPEDKTSNHFGGFSQVSEDDFGGGWRSDAHLGCKVWTSGCVFFLFCFGGYDSTNQKESKRNIGRSKKGVKQT